RGGGEARTHPQAPGDRTGRARVGGRARPDPGRDGRARGEGVARARRLVLDSEALSRLAHGRPEQQVELLAYLKAMTSGVEVDLVTSSAVLAEVLDGRRDGGVWSALRRHTISRRAVDDTVATRAGHLLTAAGMDSTNAVDAFVA